jgi:hypothetical protein
MSAKVLIWAYNYEAQQVENEDRVLQHSWCIAVHCRTLQSYFDSVTVRIMLDASNVTAILWFDVSVWHVGVFVTDGPLVTCSGKYRSFYHTHKYTNTHTHTFILLPLQQHQLVPEMSSGELSILPEHTQPLQMKESLFWACRKNCDVRFKYRICKDPEL